MVLDTYKNMYAWMEPCKIQGKLMIPVYEAKMIEEKVS